MEIFKGLTFTTTPAPDFLIFWMGAYPGDLITHDPSGREREVISLRALPGLVTPPIINLTFATIVTLKQKPKAGTNTNLRLFTTSALQGR